MKNNIEYLKYKHNKYNSKLHKLSGGTLTPDEQARIAKEIATKNFNVKDATEAMRADFNYMLEAGSNDIYNLEDASDALKADLGFVLAAVSRNNWAFLYAAPHLKTPQFLLDVVSQNGEALLYASDTLKKDPKFVLEAVSRNSGAIHHTHISLTTNREFVLEAVSLNSIALHYADISLKKNREFVLDAVSLNGRAFQYADNSLKTDPEFVLDAVSRNGMAFQYADISLTTNREFALEAVRLNSSAFQYVDSNFKNDYHFVLDAVILNGMALEFVEKPHRKNHNIIKAAEHENRAAILFSKNQTNTTEATTHYNNLFKLYYSKLIINIDQKLIKKLLSEEPGEIYLPNHIEPYEAIYNNFLDQFVKNGETFIDLGSAPGGFSKFAIVHGLNGTALTLAKGEPGAIDMIYTNVALKILYKDLFKIDDQFINQHFAKNVDFINCGAVSYNDKTLHGALLISQLYIASKCLKKGGTIMFISDMFQYIYMSIEILNIFAMHCPECTFDIVPTPISFKKSQVYIVVKNVSLTNQIVRAICYILRKYIYIVSKEDYFCKLDRVFRYLNVESLFFAYDLYIENTKQQMECKEFRENDIKIYNKNYETYSTTLGKHIKNNCLVCEKD